jgi:hypothetical protein
MQLLPTLLKMLEELPAHFSEGELAYLGATSRIDVPVRDKVAYLLHRQLGAQYLVSREWRRFDFPGRCDVALLQKTASPLATGAPKAIVQFKANANPTDMGVYILEMQSDLIRLRDVAQADTELFHIVIVAVPSASPATLGDKTERPGFNPANPLAMMQNWTQMFQQLNANFTGMYMDAINRWQDYAFITLGLDSGKLNTLMLPGGTYYQTPMQYMLFINGPFTVADNIFQISGWRKKE